MKNLIKILIVILTLVIPSYSVFAIDPSFKTDYDPTVDIQVTVEIQKIRSLEKQDPAYRAEEIIDENSDPDFYIKIFINQEEFVSSIYHNTKYIYNPELSATKNVADDIEEVDIVIQLWDAQDENFQSDRLCDISADSGSSDDAYDVELTYNIKTGHWYGDDYNTDEMLNADPSGYGRLNGCDDGTLYETDRDCELWFTIYQNDQDNDKIPYWTEVNELGTDPEIDDTDTDYDEDQISTYWEYKWGYNPTTYDNHKLKDFDEDGLDNIEEFIMADYYSDPHRRDLFVELDQMADGPNGETSRLPETSKEILHTVYDRNNVVYHLDDGDPLRWGELSDSDLVPFDEVTECSWGGHDELDELYEEYFLHQDNNIWKKGIFHYGKFNCKRKCIWSK
jgi:hypothetical protein